MSTAVLTQPRADSRHNTSSGVSDSPRCHNKSLQSRARRLIAEEIDFIPNTSFLLAETEEQILHEEAAVSVGASRDAKALGDLPGHLARMCESKLLTAEEESRLFRRMNFLKFRANSLCSGLDLETPDAEQIEWAEGCVREAKVVRDQIIQANMRLVMSVVKKFVTPQCSFDDLLSDGIYSLMQAVEKFDFDRGFRFSTYAYRAIARNAYRHIADKQKENTRYSSSSEEAANDPVDQNSSSNVYEEAWARVRGLLAKMMHRLDRRERFIIRSRYALGGHRKVRTFQCLADKLGVSKERVRQLEQRAVSKLRDFAAEEQLDEIVGAVFG